MRRIMWQAGDRVYLVGDEEQVGVITTTTVRNDVDLCCVLWDREHLRTWHEDADLECYTRAA